MLDYGVFYEFIPMDSYDGINSPKVISLEDVKLNTNYALVISTNAGLWRYIIGDTIKFTSKSPYRFKITGRTKSFINAFGEELIVENAEQAIAYAAQQTNAQIKEYTAAPVFMELNKKGRHEWCIEFIKPPNQLIIFTEALDQKLKELNSDYEAKRTGSLSLTTPKVNKVPPGTFDLWLKQKGKLGGQHKIPRLSNNRAIIEEILALL
jgi:hypothetical protein